MKNLVFIISLLLSSLTFARTVEVDVHGMTCAFCVDNLQKRFNKMDSVVSVDVSLKNNKLKLITKGDEPSVETIKKSILDAGFMPVKVTETE